MNLKLKIWRQDGPESAGHFKTYAISDVSEDSSFLEMLDLLNEQLVEKGEEPVAFDSDCREGVCGVCSLTINGIPHGGDRGTTTCQLHMRKFSDGDTITIEPFRAKAFPIHKDLAVDRSGLDQIIQSGGFITCRTGGCQDANEILIPKKVADDAFDFAACIGCGACVAACKNASAMLFTGAKVSHMNILPQGKPEKDRRSLAMVAAMDDAGFGNCRNYGECSAVCPKEIPLDVIAKMNRDYAVAAVKDLVGV